MKRTENDFWDTEPYSIILSKLWCGSNNAISVKKLCEATGLSDRALRKCIETMRGSGVCIISDANGYYRPATEDELLHYIKRTEKTARSYFFSLRSAKMELRRMKEEMQMHIEIEV